MHKHLIIITIGIVVIGLVTGVEMWFLGAAFGVKNLFFKGIFIGINLVLGIFIINRVIVKKK